MQLEVDRMLESRIHVRIQLIRYANAKKLMGTINNTIKMILLSTKSDNEFNIFRV